MKSKIVKMIVYCKESNMLAKFPDRPMLGFLDSEKIGGIPNKLFPLVIIATVGKFDISQIIINGGSSCHIMYSELL